MKSVGVFGLVIIGALLVAGTSSERLSSAPSLCEKCVELLSLVQATRYANDIYQQKLDTANNLCEAICSGENEEVDDFYVSLKDCQTCVKAISTINSHYQGRNPGALGSALSYGCSNFDFGCKRIINDNRSQLIHLLSSTKDPHSVCRGIHKC